jgi:hypothetical protein
MAVRKPSIHFSAAIPARNNPTFDWFVIGEKEEPRSPAEDPPLQRVIVRKLKSVSQLLIINKLVVEAAGVELSSVLTARKLLIPGTATTAKKASLPDPLYVYCTKILSL